MARWEYLDMRVNYSGGVWATVSENGRLVTTDTGNFYASPVLSDFGWQGWELFFVAPSEAGLYRLFFRRQVKDDNEDG